MKTISILYVILHACFFTGIELKQPTEGKHNHYVKSVAGMPVYEQDYQLSAASKAQS